MLLSTKQRPQVLSPAGVQDVLLTPGELLATEGTAQFPACRPPEVACMVVGTEPGAIDGFMAVPPTVTPEGPRYEEPPYGFRCVWPEEAR